MTDASETETAEIGATAGLIWQHLSSSGPTSMTKLVKDMDVSRDLILQGLGWLAREDKLQITRTTRGRVIALR